ncbi:MAG: X-Pro aminopeptidase [Alphaproteobacteria bacterium]|nr:MAG: X-Pro aminopeptidase [Alphaproteobacteria bacterium]
MRNRLLALRQSLRELDLCGFIIPHADEHQCEYTPERARRLTWLTGFAGSAGLSAITLNQGAIYVDGRYTLQVKNQVDVHDFEPLKLHEDKLEEWFLSGLEQGCRVGYDPMLHTQGWIEKLSKPLADAGIELVPVVSNPIDGLWADRPESLKKPVFPQPLEFSGEKSRHKRARLGAELKADNLKAAVLTSLDSIAWLLNIRGSDVDHSPLVLGYLILKNTGKADFFVDEDKISDEVRTHLGAGVSIKPYANFLAAVKKLGRGKGKTKNRILLDPKQAPVAVREALCQGGAEVVEKQDPCQLPKACKNETELNGMRAAHIRDGVAMCKFLFWFEENVASGEIDELVATDVLLKFRQNQANFRGLSFDTISGAGPNGAIVHYRSSPETNRRIKGNMLYLLDSGGQYLDGTTDLTRTLAIGKPTEEQRDRYTRVLKGHIALAQARFPVGRSGAHLDVLARKPLWDVGLDYDHGTGHGVGCYLGVHEGPQSISRMGFEVSLQPGMVLSNEPGFYKAGEYGIRIENLMIVRPSHFEGEDRPMNIFETITFVPIDTRLVNAHMMSSAEITWLNIYHAQVREKISPYLEDSELDWLVRATQSVMVI